MTEIIKSKVQNAKGSWVMWLNTVVVPALMLLEQNSELWLDYLGDTGNAILMFTIIANGLLRAFKTKGAL